MLFHFENRQAFLPHRVVFQNPSAGVRAMDKGTDKELEYVTLLYITESLALR